MDVRVAHSDFNSYQKRQFVKQVIYNGLVSKGTLFEKILYYLFYVMMTTRLFSTLFLFVGITSLLFVSSARVFSQTNRELKVDVISVQARTPYLNPHLAIHIDTKVKFRLTNTTNMQLKLYGSKIEGVLYPIRYLLEFDKQSNQYRYPERNNKPLKWSKVSEIYKDSEVIKPGESFEFESDYASQTSCGKYFKVTVTIGLGKSQKVKEVRSGEFSIGECKNQ